MKSLVRSLDALYVPSSTIKCLSPNFYAEFSLCKLFVFLTEKKVKI